ncbi:MAG TPA: LytTR family DNA-binding domain-containing protein [Bacteroidales bacterium]|nr:LytTR family DNA-binding domain-containing protein [Bacteroidales bacterium]
MNKVNQITLLIRKYFSLFLSISLGIFLFVLFFQPFSVEGLDFNNRLIFIAGLSGITFLLMIIVKIFFSFFITDSRPQENNPGIPVFLSGLSLLVLSSVSFAFYLRYVGDIPITFFIMLKVVIICLVPPVTFRIYDIITGLKMHNDALIRERKNIQKQVEKYEEEYLNKSITFSTDNGTDSLKLQIAEVAYIRSADNYVEIVFREGDVFRKKLVRTTLKGIEKQIKDYTNFIRCHRICIINSHFVEKLVKSYSSYWISIKGIDEKLPVSRQYLLKVKEVV